MRKYEKIDKDKLHSIIEDAISGMFSAKDLSIKYQITKRKLYYIFNKYNVSYNLLRDNTFRTQDYCDNISKKLKGITRSEETREKYRKVASNRKYKNNKEPGTYNHNEITKNKIKNSNKKAYLNKPEKWLRACLENPNWYDNLKKSAKNRPKRTEEHIRKLIESRVGMSYDEWIDTKTKYESYAYSVRKLTYQTIKKYNHLINGEKNKINHLDHIVSIYDGFRHNIEAKIIAHYTNLRYIPAIENLTKNKHSDKSIQILIKEYYASE